VIARRENFFAVQSNLEYQNEQYDLYHGDHAGDANDNPSSGKEWPSKDTSAFCAHGDDRSRPSFVFFLPVRKVMPRMARTKKRQNEKGTGKHRE
jgi:hypothetical protein